MDRKTILFALLITMVVTAHWLAIAPLRGFCKTNSPLPDRSGERTLSPYFLVKSEDSTIDQMPLKATSAQVRISGVIAAVHVTQVYRNEGKKTLEALYIFPGSTRAAVYGMRMTIGSRVIEAKVEKREEARRTYEQARDRGKSASLLEQQRPNVFQMNVANILPGDEVKVELQYTELLVPTGGVYEFVYPTVVGPRYSNRSGEDSPAENSWVQNPYLHAGENPAYTFDIQADLAAGMPIKQLGCPSHKVNVKYQSPSAAHVSLDGSEKSGGNRDYVLRYQLNGDRIETGLLLYEGEKENFFLLMAEPPKEVRRSEILDREYIFVVDVSGSMWGYPLEVSKKLIKDLLGNLRPSDLFNIILFSGGSSVMAAQSMPATTKNIEKGIALIDRQQGGGGTELLPALRTAFDVPAQRNYSRTLAIVTDGFVDIEAEAFELIRSRLGSANVFAFGIGTSVNRHLIEGIATVGMGESFVVARPEEAASRAERFRAMIQSPVLTRVDVKFNGFDAYDVEPPHIPDVLTERPVMVFGKYHGKPAGKIVVSGISGHGDYQETIGVESISPSPLNGGLRYLWARHRIRLLSDFNSVRNQGQESEAITELGLRYNLLTAFTSFIAVDTQIRSQDGKPISVKQPLPLPQGVSDYAVGQTAMAPAYAGGGYAMKAKTNGHLAFDTSMRALGRAPMSTPELPPEPNTERAAEIAKRTITVGEIIVSGGLTREAVSKVVRERMPGLESLVRGSDANDRLVLNIRIGAKGKVRAVKVLQGTADFQKDMIDQVRKWQFPSTSDGIEALITVTLLLSA